MRKIENMQKRALRFLINDYVSSYEQLLQKSRKTFINLRNHRALCTDVFKTMIDLNPSYMKDIFERSVSNKRLVRENYKMNLVTAKTNQETADFVTFTEEILNGKLHFLCSEPS